jgi:CheY-like chemotaxis protein
MPKPSDPISGQHFLEQLPFLRRYSYAVTGYKEHADALVLSTVQSLNQDSFDLNEFDRVAIYSRFTEIWNGPAGDHLRSFQPSSKATSTIEKNLDTLPRLERQILLLGSVEDFNDEEISDIIQIPIETVHEIRSVLRYSIAKLLATDVLIIEDEPLIADDLHYIMTALGHKVCFARTHTSALRVIEERKVGLVLADVQLADGSSGLDAANDILRNISLPIIFITGYPERLLSNKRPEPTFVLSKPFNAETVQSAVTRALFFGMTAKLKNPALQVSVQDKESRRVEQNFAARER